MNILRIDSKNRGGAKRLLNSWHESADVRSWPLIELQNQLQIAVNEKLVTVEAVNRMLAAQGERHHDNQDNTSGQEGGDHGDDGDSDSGEGGESGDDGDDSDADGDGESKLSDSENWEDNLDTIDSDLAEGDDDGDGDSNDDDTDDEKDDEKDDADDEKESEGDDETQDETQDENESDGLEHEMMALVLSLCRSGLNVSLIGPTGCGKSVLAAQVAKKLGRSFTTNGTVFSKYDIIGFLDGGGTYHSTPLYDSYVNGGLHCFDEKDRSAPDAVVAFNGMIDGQPVFAFPNGLQTRHVNFLAISCMNTLALGATSDYTAQKQDASAESRFVYVEMGYDFNIEKRIGPADIVSRVIAIRAACEALHIAHILPTRAIAQATAARKIGRVSRRDIDKCILFKALNDDAVHQIKAHMRNATTGAN